MLNFQIILESFFLNDKLLKDFPLCILQSRINFHLILSNEVNHERIIIRQYKED